MQLIAPLILLLVANVAFAGSAPFLPREIVDPDAFAADSVHLADVDGDGRLDVVAAAYSDPDPITVHLNDGANPGDAFTEIPVTSDAPGAFWVRTADLDRDGDLDVLSASFDDDTVAFYVNDLGGTLWTRIALDDALDGAWIVESADFDRDGHPDVVAGGFNAGEVRWYRNGGTTSGPGGVTATFTHHTVAMAGAWALLPADVDGDGDTDLVVSEDAAIVWYENDGTPGGLGDWVQHPIAGAFALGMAAADLDHDGDLDLLTAADTQALWYEQGADPDTWTLHTIALGRSGVVSIAAYDVDQDGDADAVLAAESNDRVSWFENDGTPADDPSWPETIVSEESLGPESVAVGDVDQDGDPDVVSASIFDDVVAWHPNDALHRRMAWMAPATVSSSAGGAAGVAAGDVDGDGRLDLLSAAQLADEISWYRLDPASGVWSETAMALGGDAFAVDTADFDGDGDLDAAAVLFADDAVVWLQNTGAGSAWVQRPLSDFADPIAGPLSVRVADLDRDGWTDVVVASRDDDAVAWYRNPGPAALALGMAWAKTVIGAGTAELDGAWDVAVGDVDRDGDLDVVSVAEFADEVLWHENQSDGAAWTAHMLSSAQNGPRAVAVADVDRDGLLDVAVASRADGVVAWYANPGDPASSGAWSQTVITNGAQGPRDLAFADMDRDGDLDLVAVEQDGSTIQIWIEQYAPDDWGYGNQFFPASLPQSIVAADFDGDGDPDAAVASDFFGGVISWVENVAAPVRAYIDVLTPLPFIVEGSDGILFGISFQHVGRPGDRDVRLASLGVRFSDTGSTPLTPGELSALVSELRVRLSDPSTMLEQTVVVPDPVPDADGIVDVAFDWILAFPDLVDVEVSVVGREGGSGAIPNTFRAELVPDRVAFVEADTGAPVAYGPEQERIQPAVELSPPPTDTDGDGQPDYLDLDDDGDGLCDGPDELAAATSGQCVGAEDADGNGVLDPGETDPLLADSDADGFDDFEEAEAGTDPRDPASFPRSSFALTYEVISEVAPVGYGPEMAVGGVAAADMDGDGDADALFKASAFLAWRAAEGPLFNEGANVSSNFYADTSCTDFLDYPGVGARVQAHDFDHDGDLDVAVGIPGLVCFYESQDNGLSNGQNWVPRGRCVGNPAAPARSFAIFPPESRTFGAQTVVAMNGNTTYDLCSFSGPFPDADVLAGVWLGPSAGHLSRGDIDGDGDDEPLFAEDGGTVAAYGLPLVAATGVPAIGPALAADLDRDGDNDIVVPFGDGTIRWFEAVDPVAGIWIQHVLATESGLERVELADMDSDGDLDVLVGRSNGVSWHENLGDASLWEKRAVAPEPGRASQAVAGDFDGDGDLDVVSAPVIPMQILEAEPELLEIRLHTNERLHRSAAFAVGESIAATTVHAETEPADLDRDGDLDLVVVTADGTTHWYENDGGAWPLHAIRAGFGLPFRPAVADVDGDGDVDVVGRAQQAHAPDDDQVVWWENDGTGTWPQHAVCTFNDTPFQTLSIAAGDVDGDGWVDVVAGPDGATGPFVALCTQGGAGAGAGVFGVTFTLDGGSTWSVDVHRPTGTVAYTVGDPSGNPSLIVVDGEIVDDLQGGGFVDRGFQARIALADLNRDAKLDVVVADADGIDWYERISAGYWEVRPVAGSPPGSPPSGLRLGDLDQDGDLDVVATFAETAIWYENLDHTGGAWQARPLPALLGDARALALADLDRDGDLDVVRSAGSELVSHENRGGQLAVEVESLAPGPVVGNQLLPLLFVRAIHRGQPGEAPIELESLALDFYEGGGAPPGVPLAPASLGLLAAGFTVHRDDGSGSFEPEFDPLIADLGPLAADPSGRVAIALPPGAIVAEAAGSSSAIPVGLHLVAHPIPVVAQIDARVVLRAQESGAVVAEPGQTKTASLEVVGPDPEVTVTVQLDTDTDGLSDVDELALGTGIGDPDSDDDGLLDGEEIALGTDPNDPDSDDDFVPDGAEVDAGSDPNDPASVPAAAPFVPQPALGPGVRAAAQADLDRDGDADLAIVRDDGSVSWLENEDGTLGEERAIDTGLEEGCCLVAADFDHDGDPDLAVGTRRGVFWYRNDSLGTPTFSATQVFATDEMPVSGLAVVDFNRDGWPDLVVSSLARGVWWIQNGLRWPLSNALLSPDPLDAGQVGVSAVAAGPVVPNGFHQVVYANRFSDEVRIYPDPNPLVGAPDGPNALDIGDVDGDGRLDVLVASTQDDTLRVLRNVSDDLATWSEQLVSATADGAFSASLVDLDRDGDLDVLSAAYGSGLVTWHESRAGGTVWAPTPLGTRLPGGVRSALPVDLDRDGDLDVVRVDDLTVIENVSVHRSAIFSPPAPVVAGVGVVSLAAGDLDRDGDLDLATVERVGFNDTVAVYESPGVGSLGPFVRRTLRTNLAQSPEEVGLLLVDRSFGRGDGDLDVLVSGAALEFDFPRVEVFENEGIAGMWPAQFAPFYTSPDPGAPAPSATVFADLDRDGAGDLVLAFPSGSSPLAWSAGPSAPLNAPVALQYTGGATGFDDLAPADIDGDGDLDLAFVSDADDRVGWVELMEAPYPALLGGSIRTVVAGRAGLRAVAVADLDGDGDLDLISGASNGRIERHLNVIQDLPAFDFLNADIELVGPGVRALRTADLDQDGDVDLVVLTDSGVGWYENLGAATFFPRESWSVPDPEGLELIDYDRDGDLDLLTAALRTNAAGEIVWIENRGGQYGLDVAPLGVTDVVEGATATVMDIALVHRGRAGESSLLPLRLGLRLEDGSGTPLASASDRVSTIRVRRVSNGSVIGQTSSLSGLVGGLVEISLVPGASDFVAPGGVVLYHVEVVVAAGAATAVPAGMGIFVVPEASSAVAVNTGSNLRPESAGPDDGVVFGFVAAAGSSSASSCGLGTELALVLPVLLGLRRRRRGGVR